MARTFNVAGPCRPLDHYMLPPERRLGAVRPLIEQKAFFVVHAPRQTGKTTSLQSLARTLTAEGDFAAVHASCKPAATAGDDAAFGTEAMVHAIEKAARLELAEALWPEPAASFADASPANRLELYLTRWSASCPRPVVLFLDEFDALAGKTLLSVLDQLHSGYTARPAPFPHALALIGLRDVRDYRLGGEGRRLGTSSPFNIKLESLRLRDFTAEEVAELTRQHTDDTGQTFADDATARVFELTRGQPWLVNALARQAVTREATNPKEPVTREHIEAAKERLILRRDTHVDSLIDRLREARVRRVIEPILAGNLPTDEVLDDDVRFVKDLGLVARGPAGLEIANPIYREVVPRALAAVTEEFLPVAREPYLAEDGQLRFDPLLDGFAAFWRQHAEHFLHRQPYSEAAAQLIFMAYLQRVVNGGSPAGVASIDREYAIGRGRIDLCLRWPLTDGTVQRFAVELKVWRGQEPDPLADGLDQLVEYLERLELDRGVLMLFDRRPDAAPLPERIERSETTHCGRDVVVWRL
ncbi:MAG: AAA family ATPase [Acidobacteriota bacterium]